MRGKQYAAKFFSHAGLTILQQGQNAAAGVIIVRSLDKAEYAHYVIAFGLASAIGILAEAGVVSTLLRRGVHLGAVERASLVAQAVGFRRRTTVISSLVVLPLAVWLLVRSGVSPWHLVLLLLLVISGSFASAASQMSVTVVRLDLQFGRAGRVLAASATARLGLTIAVVWIPPGLQAPYLLMVFTAAGVLEVLMFRSVSISSLSRSTRDEAAREEFRQNAKRIIPNNAFYLAQGQLLAWVLAGLGSVETLAEVSALARFSILFAVLALIISNFSTSFFARAKSGREILLLMGLSMGVYLAATSALLAAFATFPNLFLVFLGEGYRGLGDELVIVNCGALIGGLTGVMSSVSQGRAWLKWSWIYIPITSIWLAGLAAVVGFSSLERAAVFTALAPVTGLISEAVMITTGFRRDFGKASDT